ncbi:hypothetical protein GQ54DRAFT_287295 [Martensiomyces pterosporus]|nr:hypothetical protein GQ54DRAFT_287295 [Martensiomyces pterosporus]
MAILGAALNSGFLIAGGLTINVGGPGGALVAFALSILMVYAVITSLMEVAALMPADVPYYMYGAKILGRAVGAALAWNFWLSWIAAVAYEVIASGIIIQFWLPHVHSSVWCLLALVMCACIVAFDAKYYSAAETGFTMLKLCAIIAAIVAGAAVAAGAVGGHRYGFENWQTQDGPFFGGIGGIICASVLANFATQGAEVAAAMATKSRNPKTRRYIPWVVCGVLAALFITSIFVTGLILPQNSILASGDVAEAADASVFTVIFQKAGLKPATHIMNVVILLSVLFDCCTCLYISSTVLQDLAARSLAPSFLCSTRGQAISAPSLIVCCALALVMWGLSYIHDGTALMIIAGAIGVAGFITWGSIAIMHCIVRWSKAFREMRQEQKASSDGTAYLAMAFPLSPAYCLLYELTVVIGLIYIAFWANFDVGIFLFATVQFCIFAMLLVVAAICQRYGLCLC